MGVRTWIATGAVAAAALAAGPAPAQLPQGSEPPWPHIFDIRPSSAPPGAQVTIEGAYFRTPMTVLLGGHEAQVVSENGAEIVVIVPPHAPGRVSVQVRDEHGRGAVRGWGFRYLPAQGAGGPQGASS